MPVMISITLVPVLLEKGDIVRELKSWIFPLACVEGIWWIGGFIVMAFLRFYPLYKPSRYAFFMTNKGIFSATRYQEKIYKYRVFEGEHRFGLYITVSTIGFNGALHTSYHYDPVTATVWHDFIYNEKDKLPIFKILAQWERDKEEFEADTVRDKERLHEYLDSFEPVYTIAKYIGINKVNDDRRYVHGRIIDMSTVKAGMPGDIAQDENFSEIIGAYRVIETYNDFFRGEIVNLDRPLENNVFIRIRIGDKPKKES
jgi:hypothetical protein